MLPVERRQRTVQLLEKNGSVRVADLCLEFGVADETVRRDLLQLEDEGLLERTHGGAILPKGVRVAVPYDRRREERREAKEAIARSAVDLVADGSSVLLDNGTTTLQIARALRDKRSSITAVTTSPAVAIEALAIENSRVIMTGGVLDRDSMSLIGPDATRFLQKITVDIAFIGVSGVTPEKGFTASSVYDSEIKRLMLTTAETVVVVADGSKVGVSSLVPFADVGEVDLLLTDTGAPPETVSRLKALGLTVKQARSHRS